MIKCPERSDDQTPNFGTSQHWSQSTILTLFFKRTLSPSFGYILTFQCYVVRGGENVPTCRLYEVNNHSSSELEI